MAHIDGSEQSLAELKRALDLQNREISSLREIVNAQSRALNDIARLRSVVEHLATLEGRVSVLENSLPSAVARRVMRVPRRLARRAVSGILLWRLPENRRIIKALRPSGLFDAGWYTARYPDVADCGIDPLTHYVLFGAAEGRAPNGIFDPGYYIAQQPDKGRAAQNPLWHYFEYGAGRGSNPHPDFDASWYLEQNSDIAVEAGVSPLAHYLTTGRLQHRDIRPVQSMDLPKAQPPELPDPQSWDALAAQRGEQRQDDPKVDIVVPVYRGRTETLACLYSVLTAKVSTAYELIVLDDASPEPDLSRDLQHLAELGLIRLMKNTTNLGFVKTVNKGMAVHPDRDVVLLNSDTVTYNDWLDRLRDAAYSDPRAGTVTPLSNNATICSYPQFMRDNTLALEIDFRELDALAAEVNHQQRIAIPTAVGFCMYVRRDCLSDVGLFDADRFGMGYGEETEFCLRAARSGWMHLLAGDVFVRHCGRVSFQGSAPARMAEALRILETKYPTYTDDVQLFIQRDPGRPIRERLDLARTKARLGKMAFLIFADALKGGSDRHIREVTDHLEEHQIGVLLARPVPNRPGSVRLVQSKVPLAPNIPPFDLGADLDGFVDVLRQLGVAHILVQHPAHFGPEMMSKVPDVAAFLGIPYDVTVHDYSVVCPRLFMIDHTGVYCGGPGIEQCESCIERNSSPFGLVSVRSWRWHFGSLLSGARRVFVPSSDVAARLSQYFPSAEISIRPHPEQIPTSAARKLVPPRPGRAVRRVAVVGAIGQHKGFDILHRCARDAVASRTPLQFVVIGYTENDDALRRLGNVTITGEYREEDAANLIASADCDIGWVPSPCPETYSYALSHLLRAGLFPVAFDIGAPAERIQSIGWGRVIPLDLAKKPSAINDFLLRLEPCPARTPLADWGTAYESILTDYYGLDVGQPGPSHTDIRGMSPQHASNP